MACCKLGVATRAFVAVLLSLAHAYQLASDVNRDSSRELLLKGYKKVLLKVHPDNGGWGGPFFVPTTLPGDRKKFPLFASLATGSRS